MDKTKLKQFIFASILKGYGENDILNFLKTNLKSATKTVGNTIGQAASNISDSGGVFSLIKKYFPQDQWQNALKVAQGESGLNPSAKGDDYPIAGMHAPSYGLFQIRALPGRPDPKQLVDPEFNIKYASDMYKSQGWRPWTVARNLGLVPGG